MPAARMHSVEDPAARRQGHGRGEASRQCGIAFAPPAIDIDALRAYKEKVIATLTGGLKQLAGKRKVTMVRGRARFENSQTLQGRTDQRPAAD